MVRKTEYSKMVGLDDRFFAHMEEIDLCWRLQLEGKNIFVVPQSVVWHLGGGTLPNDSPWKLKLNYRNNLLMLQNKDQLDDMKTVYDTFSKKGNYTYEQVYSKVSRLQKNIKTDSTAQISQDKVSGIFIKYAVAGKLYSKNPVTAENMVNFLYDNMDTNELLRDRIDDQKRTDIENASDDISRAKNLFKGDNYSRYLINVSIPVESQESFEFVEQFNDELKAVYGDEAYAAGEMITTYDLKESFAHDLKLITILLVLYNLTCIIY